MSAGLRDEDHPTIPPLRISLHSSTSSSRVASSAAVAEELEQRLSELKVSIPLSSLRGAQRSDGEGGGEKGREKHYKKKHKKHKKRHEEEVVQQQQVSGGSKGVPRAEVGGKQLQFGLEGERKSYQVSGGGKGAPRAEVGGKQFGLEAERKSCGGKGLGAAYQTSPVREDVDPVKGGGGGGMSSVLKTERAHQSHREHQSHPPVSILYITNSPLTIPSFTSSTHVTTASLITAVSGEQVQRQVLSAQEMDDGRRDPHPHHSHTVTSSHTMLTADKDNGGCGRWTGQSHAVNGFREGQWNDYSGPCNGHIGGRIILSIIIERSSFRGILPL